MDLSIDIAKDKDPLVFLHNVPKGTMPRIEPKDPESKSMKAYSVFIGNLEIVVFTQDKEGV